MNYRYNEYEKEQCCPDCCCNKIVYIAITTVISILFAAGIGLLFGFGLLGSVPVLVGISLGIAGVSLIFLLIATIVSGTEEKKTQLSKCLCRYLAGLLIGSIGSLFFGLAAISVISSAAFIASIIIISLLALTLAVLIITWIFVIRCVVCKDKC